MTLKDDTERKSLGRFLVFAGEAYYARAGMGDFRGSFNSLAEAKDFAASLMGKAFGWYDEDWILRLNCDVEWSAVYLASAGNAEPVFAVGNTPHLGYGPTRLKGEKGAVNPNQL
jgi:hypothetical protein